MEPPQELTDIQRFYKNSTVFLTGATGFVGKLVLEKILRALPVKKVFILVRKKKDVPADKRFQDVFESPAFDNLKRGNPDAFQKVTFLEGDCSLPMLGLNQEDQKTFYEEIDVIFHVAATIRLDNTLKKAVLTNVRGTRDLINLAHQVKKLKTFVYVGTGYSNCNRLEIEEKIYPARISAENLITACETLDDDCLNSMTKTLLRDWPNTYTFSKQVVEDYINRKAKDLPICILRPTLVVSTLSEPVAAFVDNIFTFAGTALVNQLGIARIFYYKNINLDIVPADFVVNECIAVGWQTGETFKPNRAEVPVYHLSSVMDNPITTDQVYDSIDYYAREVPSEKTLLYPLYFRTTCRYNYLFLRMILHTMVGYIFDLLLNIKGQKPQYSNMIEKLHKSQEAMDFFMLHGLFLHMENTHKILRKMSFKDRELFNFDVATINWINYFSQYSKGLRFYILKDPLTTISKGQRHYNYLRNVFIFALITGTILLYVIAKIFLFRVLPFVFGLLFGR